MTNRATIATNELVHIDLNKSPTNIQVGGQSIFVISNRDINNYTAHYWVIDYTYDPE